MTTKATLTLDGYDEYIAELMKAERDIDLVAEEGLEAGADVFVAGMQRRAPHARIRRRIRKSGMGRDGNKRYLYVGVLKDTPAEEARIANVYEFGGPGKKAGRLHRRIQARPYIRPSLRQDARRARDAQVEIFQRWVKK